MLSKGSSAEKIRGPQKFIARGLSGVGATERLAPKTSYALCNPPIQLALVIVKYPIQDSLLRFGFAVDPRVVHRNAIMGFIFSVWSTFFSYRVSIAESVQQYMVSSVIQE